MTELKVQFPMRSYPLTDKEIEFIKFCREMKFGTCVLHIENGQPERTDTPYKVGKFEGLQSVKFGLKT